MSANDTSTERLGLTPVWQTALDRAGRYGDEQPQAQPQATPDMFDTDTTAAAPMWRAIAGNKHQLRLARGHCVELYRRRWREGRTFRSGWWVRVIGLDGAGEAVNEDGADSLAEIQRKALAVMTSRMQSMADAATDVLAQLADLASF